MDDLTGTEIRSVATALAKKYGLKVGPFSYFRKGDAQFALESNGRAISVLVDGADATVTPMEDELRKTSTRVGGVRSTASLRGLVDGVVGRQKTWLGVGPQKAATPAEKTLAMDGTVKDGTGKKWGARWVGSGISYYEWQPESLPHSSGGRTWTRPAKWERVDEYYMPAGVESALDRLLSASRNKPKPKAAPKPKPGAVALDVGAVAPRCAREFGLEIKRATKNGFELRHPGSKRAFLVTRTIAKPGTYTIAVAGPGSLKDFKRGTSEVYVRASTANALGTAACERIVKILPWLSDPGAFYAWAKKAEREKATGKPAGKPFGVGSDYRDREDMDVIVRDPSGSGATAWGRILEGRGKGYYMRVSEARGGWVLLSAAKVRELFSSPATAHIVKGFAKSKKAKKATKKKASKKVSRKSPADSQAATELVLYANNEGTIFPQRQAVEENLRKKYRKGKYDHSKAPKAWAYWMETAAKAYAKDFANASEWSTIFTKSTRELAAKEKADEFYNDVLKEEETVEVAKPKAKKAARRSGIATRQAKFAPGDRVSFDIPATVFMPARFGEGVVEKAESHRVLVQIKGGLLDWMLPSVLKKKKATKKRSVGSPYPSKTEARERRFAARERTAEEAVSAGYYSVLIPFTSKAPTQWHPTNATGPLSVLSRGSFPTAADARAWAGENIPGHRFKVRHYTSAGSGHTFNTERATKKKATKKKATKKKATRRAAKPKPLTIYISGLGSDFKVDVDWEAKGVASMQFYMDGRHIGSGTYGVGGGRRLMGASSVNPRIRELVHHWLEVSAREGLTEVRQTLDSLEQSVEIRTRPASKHNTFARLKDSPAARTMDARIAKYTERSYTRDDAQILIEAASKWMEYGPDYDRNIASAADDVVQALVRNQGVSTFSGILALRLADKGLLPLLRLKKVTKKRTKKATKKKATRKKAPPQLDFNGATPTNYPRVRIDFSKSEGDTPKGKRTVEEFDRWMAAESRTNSPEGGYTKTWPKVYIDGDATPHLTMRVDVDYYRKEGTTFQEIMRQRVQYNTRMLASEPPGRHATNIRELIPVWQHVVDALGTAKPKRKGKSRGKTFENILATLRTAAKAEFRKGNRRWVVERDLAAPAAERWVRMTGDGAYIRGFPTAEAAVESVFAMATKKKATKKKATKKKAAKKATKKKATKKKTRNRAAEGRKKRAKKKNVRKKARVARKKVAPRKKRTAAEERKILNAWKRGAGSV